MIGDKMSGSELEATLNAYGAQGWQLKGITKADVKGRIGPDGTAGLIVAFERNRRPGL
jgi:hypothetical protein